MLAMQGAQVDTELREELALAHGQYVELKTELQIFFKKKHTFPKNQEISTFL